MQTTLQQRITATNEKLTQLKTRLREVENRQNAIRSAQQRKDDTRRKILAGAWLLSRRRDLLPELSAYLERSKDRALFDQQEPQS